MRWLRLLVPLAVGATVVSTLVATPLAATAAPTSPSAPGVHRSGPNWSVTQAGDRWRVTWRSSSPVRWRDDVPLLFAGGARLGIARPAVDGRTFTLTTTDPRVLTAREVTFGWSTEPRPGRVAAQAADTSTGWGRERQGPVLTDDPAATGRFPVDVVDYDRGDAVLALPSLQRKSELRGRVYVPRGAPGRRPVVLFLHGMHAFCYGTPDDPGSEFAWPCPKGMRPVPSYLGYAPMARRLASRGYVVASISANAVNALGNERADLGQPARGELTLATLGLLRRGDAGRGPLRSLRGRLDLDRVGLMGHSRGGEGVVRAALANTQRRHPYGIRSLFLIAPTDFTRLTVPGISTAVVLPYCDGDVFDHQGQHYLDDTDFTAPADLGFRSSVLMLGANHNFFNTEWSPGSVSDTGYDEWNGPAKAVCGSRHPDRLTAAGQVAAGRAYLMGFFRATLGAEQRFLPLFDGSGTRARSARTAVVRSTFTAPGSAARTVAAFDGVQRASGSDGGQPGRVTGSATLAVCAGQRTKSPDPESIDPLPTTDAIHPACAALQNGRASHWSSSPLAGSPPGTAVARLRWTDRTGRVALPVAAGRRDARRFTALSLRLSDDPGVAGAGDLSLALIDGKGHVAKTSVSRWSDALVPLPGATDLFPRVQLRAVRIPLTAFAGVDLTDVRTVVLRTDRTDHGSVFVSQVALVRTAAGRPAPVSLPALSLTGKPVVSEGAAGTATAARFTAVLSRPSPVPVTAEWSATRDQFDEGGIARGASVVVPRRTGRITVPAGRTWVTVTVPVVGNDRYGTTVTISAGLSAVVGAVPGNTVGFGSVRDDDRAPTLRLGAARAVEGSRRIRFPVTLSTPSDRFASVEVRVRPGTARRGSDWQTEGGPKYDPDAYGTVTVGATRGFVEVRLVNDTRREPSEAFTLRVTGTNDATLSGPRTLTGTITDDD